MGAYNPPVVFTRLPAFTLAGLLPPYCGSDPAGLEGVDLGCILLIEQLSQADVDDVIQVGDSFRVTLRVVGGTVSLVLRMPSAKDVFEYRRGFARVLDLPYNRQELIINLAPAGALFKKLLESSEGYAGEVPVIHQAVAVKAAIDALDGAFEETGDPN
ncbi:MAG: hypothetical protein ACM3W4_00855 [Ignavibacteriales bacterium]